MPRWVLSDSLIVLVFFVVSGRSGAQAHRPSLGRPDSTLTVQVLNENGRRGAGEGGVIAARRINRRE